MITLGTSRAGERDLTRSYYDQRGSFAGSSNSHGNTSSFYDRSLGQIQRLRDPHNSDGSTSYYGPDGKFRGSSTNTTQPR